IRNLERHGEIVEKVFSGDRAAINLSGMKFENYSRGMVLSNINLEPTSMIDATVSLFHNPVYLDTWATVTFYTGTFECSAKIHLLDKEKLEPGETGIVQVHLSKPTILFSNDKYIIRNSSNDMTMGGGTVIDASPLHHKKRTAKLLNDLTGLADAVIHSDQVINLLKIELTKLKTPVFLSVLAKKLEKDENRITEEIEKDSQGGIKIITVQNKKVVITESLDNEYNEFIIKEITDWHTRNPILEEGPETEYFYGKLNFARNEAGKLYLDNLMEQIQNNGTIHKVDNSWALDGHTVKIDKRTNEQLIWVETTIRDVGLEKPNPAEIESLAHENKINKERLKMMVKYLGKKGKLIFCERDYIHHTIVDNCRKKLLKKISVKEDGINEKEFRELIQGTKKLVQILLGIFIEEGIVTKKTFYIFITEKGKQILAQNR
ncbi:MAG: hypothetical protein K8S16_00120, partial [Bacteroidales bacterium]|nr:hypothetical protein [Bacteroidales bacterium]